MYKGAGRFLGTKKIGDFRAGPKIKKRDKDKQKEKRKDRRNRISRAEEILSILKFKNYKSADAFLKSVGVIVEQNKERPHHALNLNKKFPPSGQEWTSLSYLQFVDSIEVIKKAEDKRKKIKKRRQRFIDDKKKR